RVPETLAWSAYSDPMLPALERERIFARAWQYVGHLVELGEGPGYVAARVGDIPVVVTRDRDGVLRAFLNVCRHRGSVLAAGAGVEVEQLQHHSRAESSVEANWKLVAENFLECYHCAVAHPGFSAVVDVSPDAYELASGDTFSSQFGPVRGNGSGLDTAGEVKRSQFHFLWPNTMINIFPGRTNLSIGPLLPAGPERTDRFLDYFFGSET